MIEIVIIGGVCIVVGGGLAVVGAAVYMYNTIVVLRERCENAWAQIDVQLKRRFDLIPNLVETVKGYAKHEKTTFENVTKARTSFMNAKGPKEMAEAENMLSGALKSLFAVAENYPNLKANEGFVKMQEQLEETENKISYARQFYNDITTQYNILIQKIPYVLIAPLVGAKQRELFEIKSQEKENVQVKF
ncbi:LemA family protein [Candidatus Micrarchaeota archaeon]|nr:LemA family protein [Candidatus Micrarchaeota archaeon]